MIDKIFILIQKCDRLLFLVFSFLLIYNLSSLKKIDELKIDELIKPYELNFYFIFDNKQTDH